MLCSLKQDPHNYKKIISLTLSSHPLSLPLTPVPRPSGRSLDLLPRPAPLLPFLGWRPRAAPLLPTASPHSPHRRRRRTPRQVSATASMEWPHAAPRIKPSVAGELPAARIEVNLTGGRGRLPQPSVVLAEPGGVTTRRISPLSLSEFAGAKSIFTAAVAFPLLSRRASPARTASGRPPPLGDAAAWSMGTTTHPSPLLSFSLPEKLMRNRWQRATQFWKSSAGGGNGTEYSVRCA